MKLDLGCGQHKKPGYTGVDNVMYPGVDVVCDIENLSDVFAPGSVDEIYSHHTLEHVGDYFQALREINKVCKPGAKIRLILPHFTNYEYHGDPTHKRTFASTSFNNLDHFRAGKWGHNPYALDISLRLVSVRFNWWGNHIEQKKGWKRIVLTVLNRTINVLANTNPFLCERFWWVLVGGFYSVEFNLERK